MKPTAVIMSVANPLAKHIRALRDKKARQKDGVFLVEGMQPVWRAMESGWSIQALIAAERHSENEVVSRMMVDADRRGIRAVWFADDLFNRLSDRDGPSGVMAVVEIPHRTLGTTDVGADDVWVVLHRIHNPGNLGTIIRTADAAGCAGVILCGDCADPYSPTAVKASMGSIFAIPVIHTSETSELISWASNHNLILLGTSGQANQAHWDDTWQTPTAIVLGNEGDGLPESLLAEMDATVRIPMTGTAESLNLGVAASILIYEARRHSI